MPKDQIVVGNFTLSFAGMDEPLDNFENLIPALYEIRKRYSTKVWVCINTTGKQKELKKILDNHLDLTFIL